MVIPVWPIVVAVVARRFAVLVIAFILILTGIVSLCLSYAVARGWWQGTSQAFGVGFIVGGLVDVLAIAALDQIGETSERRNREAETLIKEMQVLVQALPPREDGTTEAG